MLGLSAQRIQQSCRLGDEEEQLVSHVAGTRITAGPPTVGEALDETVGPSPLLLLAGAEVVE